MEQAGRARQLPPARADELVTRSNGMGEGATRARLDSEEDGSRARGNTVQQWDMKGEMGEACS
jgi:hypothetical protein